MQVETQQSTFRTTSNAVMQGAPTRAHPAQSSAAAAGPAGDGVAAAATPDQVAAGAQGAAHYQLHHHHAAGPDHTSSAFPAHQPDEESGEARAPISLHRAQSLASLETAEQAELGPSVSALARSVSAPITLPPPPPPGAPPTRTPRPKVRQLG